MEDNGLGRRVPADMAHVEKYPVRLATTDVIAMAMGGAEWMREAEQQATAAAQQREALRQALVKVRAHTSYTRPATTLDELELVVGLLASIERITDAALAATPPPPAEGWQPIVPSATPTGDGRTGGGAWVAR